MFRRKTHRDGSGGKRLPRFKLDSVESFYTYYVELVGVSEELFWSADISFVREIAENKIAIANWRNSDD